MSDKPPDKEPTPGSAFESESRPGSKPHVSSPPPDVPETFDISNLSLFLLPQIPRGRLPRLPWFGGDCVGMACKRSAELMRGPPSPPPGRVVEELDEGDEVREGDERNEVKERKEKGKKKVEGAKSCPWSLRRRDRGKYTGTKDAGEKGSTLSS